MKKRYTTKEAAEYLGVCQQRINHKIEQGHFPSHEYCECGRSIMIPESDLKIQPSRKVRKKSK